MKTCILRILVWIGLGLGLLVAPLYGFASDERERKRVASVTVDDRTVAGIEVLPTGENSRRISFVVDGETVANLDVAETNDENGRRHFTIQSDDTRSEWRRSKAVKGSGNLVTRTQAAPDFHAVAVSQGISVVIGGTEEIVIEADDNLIDHLSVEASRGTLRIRFEEFTSISNMHVTVQIPNNGKIDTIEASSAASVTTKQALQADELEIQLSSTATLDAALKANRCNIYLSSAARMQCAADFGSCRVHLSSTSKLNAALKAEKVTIELSSASKADISGICDRLTAAVSSSAKLNADELEAATVQVQASSGSSASVCCTGELTAGASSGAKILYTGDCQVNGHTSSGGSIKIR